MKWLKFIFSHSFFVSFCAIALCFQTQQLLNLRIDPFLYLLVFSATLGAYNFYWLISRYYFKRLNLLQFISQNPISIALVAGSSLLSLWCLILLPHMLVPMAIGGALTLLYSVPLWPLKNRKIFQKLGFIKTLLLAFTWSYVTVILPVSDSDLNPPPVIMLFSARFFFMLMLCSIFDSRDSLVDKVHGLSSLATDVSKSNLKAIMLIVFVLYMISGINLRIAFSTFPQLVAFIITGLLTLFVYNLSRKRRGYFFYYFVVDGLMLFSAMATFLASID